MGVRTLCHDEYLEQASTSTCPVCRHTVGHEVLTVGRDGCGDTDPKAPVLPDRALLPTGTDKPTDTATLL